MRIPPAANAAECTTKATAKAIASIDKACVTAGEKPACHSFADGEAWVSTMAGGTSGNHGTTYCGAPSAAFID